MAFQKFKELTAGRPIKADRDANARVVAQHHLKRQTGGDGYSEGTLYSLLILGRDSL
jgi:hypothetical protein